MHARLPQHANALQPPPREWAVRRANGHGGRRPGAGRDRCADILQTTPPLICARARQMRLSRRQKGRGAQAMRESVRSQAAVETALCAHPGERCKRRVPSFHRADPARRIDRKALDTPIHLPWKGPPGRNLAPRLFVFAYSDTHGAPRRVRNFTGQQHVPAEVAPGIRQPAPLLQLTSSAGQIDSNTDGIRQAHLGTLAAPRQPLVGSNTGVDRIMTGYGISGGVPIGFACWISLASPRMRGSSKRGPTICSPIGRPSQVLPAGTLPAGRLTKVIRKAGAIQSM